MLPTKQNKNRCTHQIWSKMRSVTRFAFIKHLKYFDIFTTILIETKCVLSNESVLLADHLVHSDDLVKIKRKINKINDDTSQ